VRASSPPHFLNINYRQFFRQLPSIFFHIKEKLAVIFVSKPITHRYHIATLAHCTAEKESIINPKPKQPQSRAH
jgi:hypothetical protein